MREKFKWPLRILAICFLAVSCSDNDNNGGDPDPGPDPNALNITPIDKLNQGDQVINSHKDVLGRSILTTDFRSYMELDESTLAVAHPCYARIKRMKNGNYILFYEEDEHGGNIHYAISSNLKLWEYKGRLLTKTTLTDPLTGKEYIEHYGCPEAVILSNGEILFVAQYRPGSDYRVRGHINGLLVMRSADNGMSWSTPEKIYQGVNWEPYLLQLSSGEIHCYFTDSSRTEIVAKDTGTALVVSNDGGYTWTPSFGQDPWLVIRSKYSEGYVRDKYIPEYGKTRTAYNDQMPVAIQINDSKEIAAVMETARPISDYDITFAYSGEGGEWRHLAADEKGPDDRNEKVFKGAGPYIVQFPSGETVMAYGQAYDGSFYMRQGDAKARNFGGEITIFSGDGYWGSLLVADPHRMIAMLPNVTGGYVRLVQYILNHDITATSRTITVDGSNAEWAATDEALFVGSKSQAQATIRCSADKDNVYFLVEVLDRSLSEDDYATIYLSPTSTANLLRNESCRIKVSYTGLESSEYFDSGSSWTAAQMGVEVKTKYLKSNTDKAGYVAEISVPRSSVSIQSGKVLVNFGLHDSEGGEDYIVDIVSSNTSKWLTINGL